MTRAERKRPDVIDGSRAARIARGSGHKQKEVSDLVKRFYQMRDMMAQLGSNPGLLGKIPGMGKLAGAGGMDPQALMAAGGGGHGVRTAQTRAKNADARKKRKRQQAKKDRKRRRRK